MGVSAHCISHSRVNTIGMHARSLYTAPYDPKPHHSWTNIINSQLHHHAQAQHPAPYNSGSHILRHLLQSFLACCSSVPAATARPSHYCIGSPNPSAAAAAAAATPVHAAAVTVPHCGSREAFRQVLLLRVPCMLSCGVAVRQRHCKISHAAGSRETTAGQTPGSDQEVLLVGLVNGTHRYDDHTLKNACLNNALAGTNTNSAAPTS